MKKERRDAYLLKKDDPFHMIVPYIMPKRTEAEVSLTESFDITELNRFMKESNENNGTNYKLFHAICTALAKTIYVRPNMNVFISGRRFWQRKDISLAFTAKQQYKDEAEETLMFLIVKPDMTLDTISKRILGDLKTVRGNKSNDLDKTMKFFGNLPRWILEIVFFIVRKLEYHGIMPASLTKGDPNYSTMMVSNLGSIKSNSCYHHISNYGTCSIITTIGYAHSENYITDTGENATRDVVDMTVTLDERIADGFYFIKSLKIIKYLLEHPQLLLETIDTPFDSGIE